MLLALRGANVIERKDLLQKFDILRDKVLISQKIQELVTLLCVRIAQENTGDTFWHEFILYTIRIESKG